MVTKRNLPYIGLGLYAVNLLDTFFTVYWILVFGIKEANPLMDFFWQESVLHFLVVKVFLVGLLIWVVVKVSHKSWHFLALLSATFVYFLLVIYHIKYLFNLVL